MKTIENLKTLCFFSYFKIFSPKERGAATFFISWICFECIIIFNKFGHLKYGTPLFMILYIIGGNAALICSYILLKKWNQISGVKDFIKQNFDFISKLLISLPLLTLCLFFYSSLNTFNTYSDFSIL